MEEKLQGLFGEQSLQLKEGVTQFLPYSNSKYPKGHAIKRYLCWRRRGIIIELGMELYIIIALIFCRQHPACSPVAISSGFTAHLQ